MDFADNKIRHHHTNAEQRRQNATTATNWDTSQEYAAAKSKTQKRVNYTEEIYSNEEEESEPDEIRQILQINRIQPNKHDHYEIKLKVNGNYQSFTIDTGCPVTIMPNNPTLYKQRDIQQLQERYQDVNKNENKFLGRIWANIIQNSTNCLERITQSRTRK